ncbi:spinster family MFS transporter [Sphingopyxis granuli]|uniref:spinster family MFS transporter n=1 Tax=Sphingopyxis granuli TaxID=267128 RepID=UPI0009585C67|nr:MFS transporter [Sphingopyxis granuli]APW71669.1 MFS transporter [Sphingopyxis granuli]AVA12751.1 MFS transporter [Sphingopyxis sp. MG]
MTRATGTAEGQGGEGGAANVSPSYRRYILTLLLVVSTLNFLDRQIINILVEPIKQDLQLADWQLGMLTGLSFALFYSVLGLPIARLADRSNRPVIIGVSLLAWSAFTALCGLAGSFVQLLLARIGVGCGEAGGGPPSHSLIADFTTPQNRASALAYFSLGSPVGTLLGLGLGAIVADAFGWRMAFFVAAVPGILLAAVLMATVKEPRDLRSLKAGPKAGIRDAWIELRSKRTFWWICFAGAATSVATYGQGAFWSSFFLRVHGEEIAALAPAGTGPLVLVGLSLGLVKGLSGVAGVITGGLITDRLARNDLRSYCSVPAIALILASPAFVLVMLAPGFTTAAGLLILPVFLSSLIFGPSFAAVQTLVSPGTRATAAAILLFILTLTGLGLGPLLIGIFSDLFAASLGSAEGLRWALLLTAPANLVAGIGFWLARRTIVQELELD